MPDPTPRTLLTTAGIVLPTSVTKPMWKKAMEGSALASLSGEMPQLFGTGSVMTLSGRPVAEVVGESGEKSSSPATFSSKSITPRKVQVTVRMSEEVQYADEDHQLEIIDTVTDEMALALARALDLIGIHGVNPLTGEAIDGYTNAISATDLIAELSENPDLDIEAAVGLIIEAGYSPDGLALDRKFAYDLKTARFTDGREKFPGINLRQGIYDFKGLNAATSSTVSGTPEIALGSGIHAVVGQFDAFKWGVQRDVGLKMLTSGDPDGQGDLSRHNEIALRMEVIYGIGVMDLDAFAIVSTPEEVVTPPEGE